MKSARLSQLRRNNKADGLAFLEQALRGQSGVRVIQYKILPASRRLRSIPFSRREPERFLIRTDLNQNITGITWAGLPRDEASPERFREVYEHVRRLLRTNPSGVGSRLIVHPVLNRDQYQFSGNIERAPNDKIIVSLADLTHFRHEKIWRHAPNTVWHELDSTKPLEGEQTTALVGAIRRAHPEAQAESLAQNITEAIRNVRTHLQKRKAGEPRQWVARFTTEHHNSTLEFYDLLNTLSESPPNYPKD